jgi:hypothetical protein
MIQTADAHGQQTAYDVGHDVVQVEDPAIVEEAL